MGDTGLPGPLYVKPPLYIYVTDLQSLPSVLLSSALCSWGCWSASFRRAACAHTMNAFIGRLMCARRLSPADNPRTGIGIADQS